MNILDSKPFYKANQHLTSFEKSHDFNNLKMIKCEKGIERKLNDEYI